METNQGTKIMKMMKHVLFSSLLIVMENKFCFELF
jgi:hypothetical protein